MSKIHIDWFTYGLDYALKNRDIVIIVDTFRFSSAVVTAVSNGFTIFPAADDAAGTRLANKHKAALSGRPGQARYSLSPLSFLGKDHDTKKVVLQSPNGSACSAKIKKNHLALIGCLLNAKAVARKAEKLAALHKRNVTVIAAGEQRAVDDGRRVVYIKKSAERVFAIEDYLGCGAIISHSTLERTAEAELCLLAFKDAKPKLKEILAGSFSGKFLLQNGREKDFDHVLQLDAYNVAPVIRDGKIK